MQCLRVPVADHAVQRAKSSASSRNWSLGKVYLGISNGVRPCIAAKATVNDDDDDPQKPVCIAARATVNDDDDAPQKPVRIERLLANLGYGKRKDCQDLVKKGLASRKDGVKLKVGDKFGYVCTSPDDDRIPDPKVYDLLPYRYGRRDPLCSPVGRLDKETSGLLLMTDDGQLLHHVISPKKCIWKMYATSLKEELSTEDAHAAAKMFASGSMLLKGEYTPLLPAKLEWTGPNTANVYICEGRYHQIRRMFGALGNEVVSLKRLSIGGLSLGDLPESEYRYCKRADVNAIFSGPTTEDIMGSGRVAMPEGSLSATKQRQRQRAFLDADDEDEENISGLVVKGEQRTVQGPGIKYLNLNWYQVLPGGPGIKYNQEDLASSTARRTWH
eukprot:gene24123-9699_t